MNDLILVFEGDCSLRMAALYRLVCLVSMAIDAVQLPLCRRVAAGMQAKNELFFVTSDTRFSSISIDARLCMNWSEISLERQRKSPNGEKVPEGEARHHRFSACIGICRIRRTAAQPPLWPQR